MKLDTKRTVLIGFGFMSILAFWQFYDQVIPHLLENVFGLRTFTTNAIMSIDNISSLVLLPLFGSLSDRCRMKMGRRMPFLLFGAMGAAALALLLSCTAVAEEAAAPALTKDVVVLFTSDVHCGIENGFGYDPLFFLPEYGMTTAQLAPEEKNRISHRANALHKLVEQLNK